MLECPLLTKRTTFMFEDGKLVGVQIREYYYYYLTNL